MSEASVRAEYARRLYANVLDWYKTADTKAQVILTLDGAFITVVSGLILSKESDLRAVTDSFGPETWFLFGLLLVSIACSVGSALAALHPRLWPKAKLDEEFHKRKVDLAEFSTYDPAVMWFFQLVARLEEDQLEQRLKTIDGDEFEIEALTAQIRKLSERVVQKHHWVNRGFVFLAVALLSLLGMGASYVLHVQLA